MSITVHEINNPGLWNDFLCSQSQGHLLQSYEWGELNSYVGRDVYRLGAFDENRLVGTMQLVVASVPLPLPKMRSNWLYCSRGPTLAHPDRLILTQLLVAARDIARRERAIVLRVEPNIADDETGVDQDAWLAMYHKVGFQTNLNSIHGRRSWVLDLRPSLDTLFANFQPAWRQHILDAEEAGVCIREADTQADFDIFYDLLHRASERDELEIYEKDYYWMMLRSFLSQGKGTVLLAEYHDEPVAAKMLLHFGNWCWDMFDAAIDLPALNPLYLIQYHALRWAQNQGAVFFDFRTIPEVLSPVEDMWNSYSYKKGFGGYSRLNIPTQDYVYQPLIYAPWRRLMEMRRDEQRHKQRQTADYDQEPDPTMDQSQSFTEI